MSLCATGMPERGFAPPRAMSASAARAWSTLLFSSTVMNAFSLPFSALIRSRQSFVSSTLEIFFCASAEESSLREAFSMNSGFLGLNPLLDHLGNEIEPCLLLRRYRQEQLALVGFRDFVLAQAQRRRLSVGHGLDSLGVDLLHLPNQLKYIVELGLDSPRLRVADADPGQLGDSVDLFEGQRHEKSLKTEIYFLYYSAIANPLS